MYLSAGFVCFLVVRKTDPQICLSSDLPLALWGMASLKLPRTVFSHSAYPRLPLSFSRERPRDSETNSQGLSYDSSMLIIIFITLYGIPLVVTERHVSFERLGTNQKLHIYRLRDSGFTSSSKTDRCCTALGTFSRFERQLPGPSNVPFVWGMKCCTGDPWKLASFVLTGIVMQSSLDIRKTAQRIPATSKECVLATGIQNDKKTKKRCWWGQHYQTLIWDRFLSTSSNISKKSFSRWPSKDSQSQSLGLKQWQNKI